MKAHVEFMWTSLFGEMSEDNQLTYIAHLLGLENPTIYYYKSIMIDDLAARRVGRTTAALLRCIMEVVNSARRSETCRILFCTYSHAECKSVCHDFYNKLIKLFGGDELVDFVIYPTRVSIKINGKLINIEFTHDMEQIIGASQSWSLIVIDNWYIMSKRIPTGGIEKNEGKIYCY